VLGRADYTQNRDGVSSKVRMNDKVFQVRQGQLCRPLMIKTQGKKGFTDDLNGEKRGER
jgi:hypothetical protein